jgi:DNA-binding beta-propeller fold protein YncE
VHLLEAKIIRSLGVAKEAPIGLVIATGEIWAIKNKSRSIEKIRNLGGKLSSTIEIPHGIANPGTIAWTGSDFLMSEKTSKVIYKLDPKKKTPEPYVDLMTIRSNRITPLLRARGTSISSIAFNQGARVNQGKLWIAIQAGYSSSIIVLDEQNKKMNKNFYTRGPEPTGIAFEANGKRGWVLDGSSKELSQFDNKGKWTKTTLRVPLEKPIGLAIDNEGNFLTTNSTTKESYVLGRSV